jgi:tetrahydromethanopterin S-methyltransferase subunit G
MSDPDNIVLAHLRELRADINTRLDKIERRLEMMHGNGEKALRQFIGHRAMVERTIATFQFDIRALELLEAAQS